MGPALETFLTALFLILIALAIAGALTRPLWKRCYRFFCRWYEGDLRAEQERKLEHAQRKLAEKELREFCHDEDAAPRQEDANVEPQAGNALPSRPEDQIEAQYMETPHMQREAPQEAQTEVQVDCGQTTRTKNAP